MQKRKGYIYLMYALIFVVFLGCAGKYFKNYGGIVPNQDATTAFEKYQVDPNLNYYYSGSGVYPNAVMGLNKAYTLDSDLWKKVDMTPQLFREFVTNMQTKALTLGQNQYGFAILDEKGKRIGVWYSLLLVRTVVQMKDNKTVIIHTPDIDTYLKFEDEHSDTSTK
ncbi:MAG: hypothetical protein FJ139_08250 [Deltaproteobacteria bacterium]|nr:hypothetical protein [Deltaproteobacteria bacterium]